MENFFFLFFIFLSILSTGLAGCNEPALFMFGDSFLDSGNNNYINTSTLDQANFRPYGDTFFKYPTGRFSDGRLISDFIAEYAKLPLIPPYLQPGNRDIRHGINFASAGAGALSETLKGWVIDLRTQLKYFTKVEARLINETNIAETNKILSNAVYMFSIGTNDYMIPYLTNSKKLMSESYSEFVGMVIGNLTTVVKAIYEKGGRKFVFLNLGDLGCFPGLRIVKNETRGGCLDEVSILAKLHNHALHRMLSKMERQYEGFKYALYDFKSNLRRRMNHPSRYGFKEGKRACCGTGQFNGVYSCGGKRPVKEFKLCDNPSNFVFWDSYHLTERVYEQMAQQMWSGDTQGPYTLKTLFQC